MTRISVELIPRDKTHLLHEAQIVKECFPVADTVNIPDLMRFPLRSYEAFSDVCPLYPNTVPHIRAIDVSPDKPLPGHDVTGLKEVLIIQGDPPSDFTRPTYPNTTEMILRRYKRELPHLTLYAAFDPYRRAPKKELEQIYSKKEAGASGFFTQPIFDEKMLDLCMEWMGEETVFWGLSPVLGPKSKSYWEITNNIIFPRHFETTMEANLDFARTCLKKIQQANHNAYLMPLKVKLPNYLVPLLEAF